MKLCMIGTGYVGLVSGTCFADLGNKVYCIDKDINKIKKLNLGKSPIFEPGLNEIIKKNFNSGRLIFSTDLKSFNTLSLFSSNSCSIILFKDSNE